MDSSASASHAADRRSAGLERTALILAAIAAFFCALHNQPIEDDVGLLQVRLGAVSHWSDVPPLLLQSYWGDLFRSGLYRPLTLAVAAAIKLTCGSSLLFPRMVSLALHAGCTLLVWRLARRMLTPTGALLTAIVFAVHPIHAEAVITFYGQSDLWATLFALAAVILHLRQSAAGKPSWHFLGVAFFYLLSLGFKESAIALPIALGLLRGMIIDKEERGIARWIGPREIVVATALVPYVLLRLWVLGGAFGPGAEAVVGGGQGVFPRVSILMVTLSTYLQLLVFPWGQTIYYGHLRDRLLATGYFEVLILLAAFAALLFLLSPKRPWTLAAGLLLAIGLFPVCGLVPIGVLVAERCLYFPSVGFALLLGGWLASLPALSSRTVATAVALLIAIGGMVLSARVCLRWATPLSVWTTTWADHPRSPRAGATVALLRLEQEGASPETLQECDLILQRVEEMNPRSPELWQAKSVLARLRGDDERAQQFLDHARALRPNGSALGWGIEFAPGS